MLTWWLPGCNYGNMASPPGKNVYLKIIFFALCKFGHRKLDITKIVTAKSFKLAHLIDDNE